MQRSYLCILEFLVFKPTHSQRTKEAYEKAHNVATALSLITQNIFLIQFDELNYFQPLVAEEQKEFVQSSIRGFFSEDEGMFEDFREGFCDPLYKSKEILEAGDVIFEGHIRLPKNAAKVLSFVLKNSNCCQSAHRFHEGLRLSFETLYHPTMPTLGLSIMPYQLIAFVASIESLLETLPKQIACPSCGHTIQTQNREISKTFVNFVEEHLVKNKKIIRMFKQIYEDRSKFVHTGKDLYNPFALLGNSPLVLEGKNSKSATPEYYNNIADFTGLAIRRYIYSKIDNLNHPKAG